MAGKLQRAILSAVNTDNPLWFTIEDIHAQHYIRLTPSSRESMRQACHTLANRGQIRLRRWHNLGKAMNTRTFEYPPCTDYDNCDETHFYYTHRDDNTPHHKVLLIKEGWVPHTTLIVSRLLTPDEQIAEDERKAERKAKWEATFRQLRARLEGGTEITIPPGGTE